MHTQVDFVASAISSLKCSSLVIHVKWRSADVAYIVTVKSNQITACDGGTYGIDCSGTCGFCKYQTDCNFITGHCNEDCEPGYEGDLCIQGIWHV